MSGMNPVHVNVTGLQQEGVCDVRVRFSTHELDATEVNDSILQVTAPTMPLPGNVVVQVALNGQQFSSERIVHQKDPSASYEYYVNPFVTYHSPVTGPSIGGTKVVISGHGFAPFIA